MKLLVAMMRFDRQSSIAILVFTLLLKAIPCLAEEASPLAEFTGAHTRVVWLQDHGRAGNDVLAAGKQLRIMKFDSQDPRGEVALLDELRNYSKPMLTPDGQRVVFSDQITQKFLVVNWDGTGKKILGDGFAIEVYRDPQDGIDWIYVAKRVGKTEVAVYRNVRRVKLDDPKVAQKVWDLTDVSSDNFQLSADGTRAGSDFPWPHGGVADLTKKTWKKLDQGCWPSIAPDNSGLSWVLDGPHRNLQFRRPDQADGWKVGISTAPNVKGNEVFHPRWSNHVRYLALTGPYEIKGAINLISGGGPQVEIHLGRFSPDYRSVEAWHQLTHNTLPDFYPDVWIEGGELSAVELPGLKNPSREVVTEWPAVTNGLLFAWSDGAKSNQLADGPGTSGRSCKVTPHGAAVFGRYFDMRLNGGFFTLDEIEPSLLKAATGSNGLTLEMLVTPDALPSKPATLCEIGSTDRPTFQLHQEGTRIRWRLGTEQGTVEVPAWKTPSINPLSTVHMGFSLVPKKLDFTLDGKSAGSFAIQLKPEDWKSAEVRLGGPAWHGQIEAVAMHARGLTADELHREARQARLRLAGRKPIPQVRLQVKCIEPSSIPRPDQILPYRRALAVDLCEVLKVEADSKGKAVGGSQQKSEILAKTGDKILIARWVILDGQPLAAANLKTGAITTFQLERLADHPELESERQIIDTTEVDLPTWYALD